MGSGGKESRELILLEVAFLLIYLVVEEILIKFYFVCQYAAIYGARAKTDPIFILIRGSSLRCASWEGGKRAKNPL